MLAAAWVIAQSLTYFLAVNLKSLPISQLLAGQGLRYRDNKELNICRSCHKFVIQHKFRIVYSWWQWAQVKYKPFITGTFIPAASTPSQHRRIWVDALTTWQLLINPSQSNYQGFKWNIEGWRETVGNDSASGIAAAKRCIWTRSCMTVPGYGQSYPVV